MLRGWSDPTIALVESDRLPAREVLRRDTACMSRTSALEVDQGALQVSLWAMEPPRIVSR